ncbi:MAG: glycoside hydrolase family 88 protein, partial [Victivallales bacterium]|nr:glycoside hydrolase family 88 protein [Victivallales bacterium]
FKHSIDSEGLCWSRASGQAIAGVTAFLKGLPNDHPQRAYFLRVFKNFAYAAERNQDGAGLWHVLPEDFNSPQDTLGSAFFVTALATGLEQKWIHRLEFREIVDLGWKGVQANIKGGKLTNAVVATQPRKVASSYALLPRTASDALVSAALKVASAATKAYYASDVPDSDEDLMAVLGPMSEITAYAYEGKLPDGRTLKHISKRASFDITFTVDIRGGKVDKLIKENPGLYTERDFRNTMYEILNKKKMQALPESIKKLKYPVGGISVWLEENPSVHTVSDELGYCVLSMPYVALSKD